MKRSTDRILTTHTGSLPLPALLRQALCKPDMVYILDRAHGLHFFKLAPCQPFAGEILLVR